MFAVTMNADIEVAYISERVCGTLQEGFRSPPLRDIQDTAVQSVLKRGISYHFNAVFFHTVRPCTIYEIRHIVLHVYCIQVKLSVWTP
jgi:hypothetical protein